MCLGTANWHRGYCHAPPPAQRGTSPRTTFPIPTPHNLAYVWDGRNIQMTNSVCGTAGTVLFVPMTMGAASGYPEAA